MFSEISVSAREISISYRPHLARSPRETIPTTLPPSTTGSRRTCCRAMRWAAWRTSSPGATWAGWRDLLGGHAPEHQVPVGDHAVEGSLPGTHRQGPHVVPGQQPGGQGDALLGGDGHHGWVHHVAYLQKTTSRFALVWAARGEVMRPPA